MFLCHMCVSSGKELLFSLCHCDICTPLFGNIVVVCSLCFCVICVSVLGKSCCFLDVTVTFVRQYLET